MCRVGRSIPPHGKGESGVGRRGAASGKAGEGHSPWVGGGMAVGGPAGQVRGPCRRSGGAGVGASDSRPARQARAAGQAGGSLAGRRRAGRVSLLPPPPAGAGLSGVIFARFGLPVRSAPCEMVPLRGVAVTAPGKASSARLSVLPVPGREVFRRSGLIAFQAGCGNSKPHSFSGFRCLVCLRWEPVKPQREIRSAVPLPCAAGAALPDRCESVTLVFFLLRFQ